MTSIQRRHFLKSGALWGAFGGGFLNLLGRQAHAQGGLGDKKMLFIFQRGGNDGLNTIIPRGDSDYSTATRPTIFIPEGAVTDAGTDLGNSFAQLHPMLAPMMDVYNSGDLACIHRVGYTGQSRSHFDSQDYWERGVPRDPAVKDGMFYRQVQEMLDLNDPENALAAVSISGGSLKGLRGDIPFPNFTRASQFNFLGNTNERTKFLGRLPDPGPSGGRGMLGLYGGENVFGATSTGLVHSAGQALGKTIESLSSASGAYTPANGAVYPNSTLGRYLQESAMLFKRTNVRIVGVNRGGHDTHTNQGAVYGNQGNLLSDLAEGFRALSLDLQDQWNDMVVVTMTEFGRTSLENGSNGTDHAEASAVFVAGGNVNGGIYNCEQSNSGTPMAWEDGAIFSRNGRYLSRKTDFRAIFGEIFQSHFGNTTEQLNRVIPGYDTAVAETPAEMTQLGIMT